MKLLKTDKIKVLYIDDEKSNLLTFKALLRREGYEIHITDSIEEARKILEENSINVVVSDQRMPVMTGVEFFESILQDYPKPIRVLTTAYTDINSVIDAINLGQVYKYVSKPWNVDCLKNAILQSFEVYKLREHNEMLISDLQAFNNKLLKVNEQLEFMLHQKKSFEDEN